MKPHIYNQHIFNSASSAMQFAELGHLSDPLENQVQESIKQTQIIGLMYRTILENQKANTKQNNIVTWIAISTLIVSSFSLVITILN